MAAAEKEKSKLAAELAAGRSSCLETKEEVNKLKLELTRVTNELVTSRAAMEKMSVESSNLRSELSDSLSQLASLNVQLNKSHPSNAVSPSPPPKDNRDESETTPKLSAGEIWHQLRVSRAELEQCAVEIERLRKELAVERSRRLQPDTPQKGQAAGSSPARASASGSPAAAASSAFEVAELEAHIAALEEEQQRIRSESSARAMSDAYEIQALRTQLHTARSELESLRSQLALLQNEAAKNSSRANEVSAGPSRGADHTSCQTRIKLLQDDVNTSNRRNGELLRQWEAESLKLQQQVKQLESDKTELRRELAQRPESRSFDGSSSSSQSDMTVLNTQLTSVRVFLERYESVRVTVDQDHASLMQDLRKQLDAARQDLRSLSATYAESDARRSAEVERLHQIIIQLTDEVALLRQQLDKHRNQEQEMEGLRARIYILLAQIEEQKNAASFIGDDGEGDSPPHSVPKLLLVDGSSTATAEEPQAMAIVSPRRTVHRLVEAHVSQLIALCWLTAGGIVARSWSTASSRRK